MLEVYVEVDVLFYLVLFESFGWVFVEVVLLGLLLVSGVEGGCRELVV